MIKVKRSKIPPQLSQPAADVKKERDDALKHYGDPKNHKKEFPFKIYRAAYVKDAIEKMFHKKCAYCESQYAVVQPVDVEHFRPKGAVVIAGQPQKLGYYWLASDWDNLLPSCIRCNRLNKYRMAKGKTETMGKKNFFPLEDESKRAKKPGQERYEKPLLLNPCYDNPAQHLEFTEKGIVRARLDRRGIASAKGETSIKIYALRRPELVQAREEYAKKILSQIELVKEYALSRQTYPKDPRFKALQKKAIDDLKNYRKPQNVYSAMARQLIDEFLKSLKK